MFSSSASWSMGWRCWLCFEGNDSNPLPFPSIWYSGKSLFLPSEFKRKIITYFLHFCFLVELLNIYNTVWVWRIRELRNDTEHWFWWYNDRYWGVGRPPWTRPWLVTLKLLDTHPKCNSSSDSSVWMTMQITLCVSFTWHFPSTHQLIGSKFYHWRLEQIGTWFPLQRLEMNFSLSLFERQ